MARAGTKLLWEQSLVSVPEAEIRDGGQAAEEAAWAEKATDAAVEAVGLDSRAGGGPKEALRVLERRAPRLQTRAQEAIPNKQRASSNTQEAIGRGGSWIVRQQSSGWAEG